MNYEPKAKKDMLITDADGMNYGDGRTDILQAVGGCLFFVIKWLISNGN
jgi:hypothetical protein